MNTKEINDGAWDTKYSVMVAAPLVIISVVLPLVTLSLLGLFLRLRSYGLLPIIGNSILLIALTFNLSAEIFAALGKDADIEPVVFLLFTFLFPAFVALPYIGFSVILVSQKARSGRGSTTLITVANGRVVGYAILGCLFIFGFSNGPGVCSGMIVAYYLEVALFWAYRKKHK